VENSGHPNAAISQHFARKRKTKKKPPRGVALNASQRLATSFFCLIELEPIRPISTGLRQQDID